MKRFSLFAGALFALGTFAHLQADPTPPRPDWSWDSSSSISSSHKQKYKAVGDFSVIGFARYHGLILSNNMVYLPQKHFRKIVDDWNLQDTVRVLQTKHKHLVLLINLRTGESVKAKRHEVHK